MNVLEILSNLMSDDDVRSNLAAKKGGKVERNIVEHYCSYCHNKFCQILIDGDKDLLSPELIPSEMYYQYFPEERAVMPDIMKCDGLVIKQQCEVKVRQAECTEEFLVKMKQEIEKKYGMEVNIIIAYPTSDGNYNVSLSEDCLELMGIKESNLQHAINAVSQMKTTLKAACSAIGFDPDSIGKILDMKNEEDKFEYNSINIDGLEKITIKTGKPNQELFSNLNWEIETSLIDRYSEISKMELKLPNKDEAKEIIKYTPMLFCNGEEFIEPGVHLDNNGCLEAFSNLINACPLALYRKGINPITKQRDNKSSIVSHEENLITVELLQELLSFGKVVRFNRKGKGNISKEALSLFGYGKKSEKRNYKVNLKKPVSSNRLTTKRTREAKLLLHGSEEKTELFQNTYTPQKMLYDEWIDDEVHYLSMMDSKLGQSIYFEDLPEYTPIDTDAAIYSNFLLKLVGKSRLGTSLTKMSNTFGYLAKEWNNNSKGSIVTIPIRVDKDPYNDPTTLIYGVVMRGPHFSKKVSSNVQCVTIQFMKKEFIDHVKFRHYTIFKLNMTDDPMYLAVKRHGTNLMKVTSGVNCLRALLVPLNCCAMMIDLNYKTPIDELRTTVYKGKEQFGEVSLPMAIIYHTIEQYFGNIFGGSQCSAFLAEMRRCQLCRNAVDNGKCYSSYQKGTDCFTKAQDSVISNPFVFFLVRAWNCTIRYKFKCNCKY